VYAITSGMPTSAMISITVKVNWLEEALNMVMLKSVSLLARMRLGKWIEPTIPQRLRNPADDIKKALPSFPCLKAPRSIIQQKTAIAANTQASGLFKTWGI